ncbi:HEPN domain-containing protein [Allorhizocola rhizosphaerae]|uniref:HEPN domain-containing protein n=1 Tax=Allorhizocola rhizosphaerae TaxID=1872709 RepID=UPI000E3D5834|nr:HEPN domain-containing protein [Allorhizocola rhizosphaerae]
MLIHPEPDATLPYLQHHLGEPMLRWLLGGTDPALTEQQNQIVEALRQQLREIIAGSRQPSSMQVDLFCSPTENGTVIGQFKELLSGPDEHLQPSGDDVLDALRVVARTAYPRLLLPPAPYRMPINIAHWLPDFKAFLFAARADPTLIFTRPSNEVEQLDFIADGFFEATFARNMILAAWEQERLEQSRVPALPELYRRLETVLDQVRLGCAGRDFEVVYLASLTGLTLPEDENIEAESIRIRAARWGDHPGALQSLLEQQTTTTLGDGSDRTITISDAGDVIVEVRCPARVIFQRNDSDQITAWQIKPKIDAEHVISRVRLACLLSWSRENPPVILPVWSGLVDPFVGGGVLASWRSPQGFAPRTPIELTRTEMDQWQIWLERVREIDLKRIGVAPARLLRAVAERTDFADALIDAVIVWEALFGDKIETTFKVTTAIIRLLGRTPEERRAIKKEVTQLYEQRSLIVHGQGGHTDQHDASQRAITLSIRCLKALIEHRPDLVPKTSGERVSALVVME